MVIRFVMMVIRIKTMLITSVKTIVLIWGVGESVGKGATNPTKNYW